MSMYGLKEFDVQAGRLILTHPSFDFDSFSEVAKPLVNLLSATVTEQQTDADLHSWLIDFEGCPLFLRGEHYSETMWIETLSPQEGNEELQYLAKLCSLGIG
ncbi:DUF3630 family protein [Vibrio aphrogenes]|uniref:DUF3630 family protein n=1 Tax=Vibrio aphrogenes TaxID=1891186 RepID=UPI000B362E90